MSGHARYISSESPHAGQTHSSERALSVALAWAGFPVLGLTSWLSVLILRTGELHRPEILIALLIAGAATAVVAWNQLCVSLALIATATSRAGTFTRIVVHVLQRCGSAQARAILARHALAFGISTTAITAVSLPVYAAPPDTPMSVSSEASEDTSLVPSLPHIDEGDHAIPDDLTWPSLYARTPASHARSSAPATDHTHPDTSPPRRAQSTPVEQAPAPAAPPSSRQGHAPIKQRSTYAPTERTHAEASSPDVKQGAVTQRQRTAYTAHDGTRYEVQVGDCLWTIASDFLGSSADDVDIAHHVEQLVHANAGVIGADPDLIYPGTIITIPPKEEL